MHPVTENEVELQLSSAAYERISAWLREELRADGRHGIIAGAVFALLAVAANVFAYLAFFLAGRYFPVAGLEVALIAPAIVVGLTYPAYLLWGRRRFVGIRLASGTVRAPLTELAPDAADTSVSDLLFFPARLSFKAIRYAATPLLALRADADVMARVLGYLLEHPPRVGFIELEDRLRLPGLARALSSLLPLDGVLFFYRAGPAISLNDELRRKLTGLV